MITLLSRFFNKLVGTCAHLFMVMLIALGILSPAVAEPIIMLADFETPDAWKTEWTITNPKADDVNRYKIVNTFKPLKNASPFLPQSGNFFGTLMTGSYIDANMSVPMLSFHLDTPHTLFGSLAFAGGDYLDPKVGINHFNDYMKVTVLKSGDQVPMLFYYADIKEVGDFGTKQWQEMSMLLGPGNYQLFAEVQDFADTLFKSVGGFDKFYLVATDGYAPVSTPGTLALLGLSLLALGGFTRRVRN
jgi:hypothetical protein